MSFSTTKKMLGLKGKDKNFSSKGKIEHYEKDGVETILALGRKFRVLKRLGQGRNSTVYLCENAERVKDVPMYVAIKRSIYSVAEIEVAHKEIELLSRIKDKNLVRVYHTEVTRSEGKLGVSVLMEYCQSSLVAQMAERSQMHRRLSEAEITEVLLAVTSAVGYLHAQQPPISHRGICIEHVFISGKESGARSYRLGGFGAATIDSYLCENREEVRMAMEDIDRHTAIAYRAPEMADTWKKRRICERVDMWAIGVLLYQAMYFRLPFDETNLAISNAKLRFPAGTETWYTGSFRVILEHLLEPDPERRWDVFALTNFLRFDEDLSRHLGTFCFTHTEWPTGWEEQEVKVVGRAVPPKSQPIQGGSPAPCGDVDSAIGRNPPTPPPTSTATTAPRLTHGADSPVDVDMNILEGDIDEAADPELAAYRRELIREQERAWEQAKQQSAIAPTRAARAAQAAPAVPSLSSSDAPPQPPAPVTTGAPELLMAAPPVEPLVKPPTRRIDPLDDLFAPSVPPAHPANSNASNPAATAPGSNDAQQWRDSLFANAPSGPPAGPAEVGMWAPQQHHQSPAGQYYAAGALPPHMPGPQGPVHAAPPMGALPMPSHPHDQQMMSGASGGWSHGTPWGTGAPLNPTAAGVAMGAAAPQPSTSYPLPQHSYQPSPLPNSQPMMPQPLSAVHLPPTPQPAAPAKDPFADLFS